MENSRPRYAEDTLCRVQTTCCEHFVDLTIAFFGLTKRFQANGEKPDCVATSMLDLLQSDSEKELIFSEEDIKQVLGTMYAGAWNCCLNLFSSADRTQPVPIQ